MMQKANTEEERKVISVLFTDVVNYTSLAEKLDLEAVREIMNNHFKLLIEAVNRYQGMVDQLLGDGMVAFFGAPMAYEDHAQRACYAALAMQAGMQQYGETIRKHYGLEFLVRIGINSGPVLVGPLGTDQHTEYIATGDTVNLAARLENASRPGGILVSQNTHSMVKDFFQFEPIGEIGVKGKDKPVAAYRLIQAVKTEGRFDAAIVKGLTRFAGREREIELLRQSFQNIHNGISQIIGIKGEPGIGKSRLFREFKGSLKSENYTYLEGHCLHYGNSMPFRLLIDIIKAYFSIQEEDAGSAARDRMMNKLRQLDESLLSYVPFLYDSLSFSIKDEHYLRMENQYKRGKLFEGLTKLLVKEASQRPLVIAIEDLHWIDQASIEFLTYLIDRIAHSRILLLLLYRPEFQSAWIRQTDFREVHLDQLSISTSHELLQSLLPDGELAPELRELVLTRAGGNPLFLEEFVHSLLENGSIRKEGRNYALNTPDSTMKLPDTVQGIIAARIDRLSADLKSTLQVASVIGREFNFTVLQDVARMPQELKSQLETLQKLEFILNLSETDYIFKHALIQEVAYGGLLQKRCKELHESIGLAIEKLYSPRLDEFTEVLAYHFQQSISQEKAVEYLRKSGRKARSRYAIEASHQYYQKAFGIISSKNITTREDQSELLDILLEWAEVFYYRGYFGDLYKLLSIHKDLAESLRDRSRQAMLLGWMGMSLFACARARDSYQCLLQAQTLAEESGDPKATAYVYTWLSWTCCFHGLIDKAMAYAEKAITVSRLIKGDDYPYIKALGGKGFLLSVTGKNRAALECGQKLIEFGELHGNLRSLALGYNMAAFYHWNTGETEEALKDCQQGLGLKVDPFYYEMIRYMIGTIYVTSGRFQEGEAYLKQVVINGRRFGAERFERMASAMLGVALISQGNMGKGFRILYEADCNFLKNGERFCYSLTQYLFGMLYSQVAVPASPIKVSLLIKNLGPILRLVPFATRKAVSHFSKCAEISRECGFGSYLGMAYLELGRFYKKKGKEALARENLTMAVKLCREYEATGSLKQAEDLLEFTEEG
jgi:class 3 adenylate cyclase/tetratricopeptide (TPR) repeat protein